MLACTKYDGLALDYWHWQRLWRAEYGVPARRVVESAKSAIAIYVVAEPAGHKLNTSIRLIKIAIQYGLC